MSTKNKVVLLINRPENELIVKVNERIVAFLWDVTGIDGNRIMRDGKVVGTLNPNVTIQERWQA